MEKGTGDIENKQEVAERASKRSEWARKESRRARGREIEYFNNFSPSAPAQTRSQRAHVTCRSALNLTYFRFVLKMPQASRLSY